MPRVGKPLIFGCLVLTGSLLAAIVYVGWAFFFVQPIQIVNTSDGVVVDLQTLGEYQANLIHLRLSEQATGKVIWEVEAEKSINPVWTIPLVAGKNPALPGILSWSVVLVPENSASFFLEASTEYIFETWSYKNGRKSHRVVEVSISNGR